MSDKVTLDLVKQLRDITGLGMMDCKKALYETDGDLERAVVLLRKKGAAVAQKRSEKAASQGLIEAYIHQASSTGSPTLGVLVEINCETDFVASTPDVREFARNIAMQIAALKPLCVHPQDLAPAYIAKETEIATAQLASSGKPQAIIDKIVVGKLEKIYAEVCLVKQPYLKDDKRTVEDILTDLVGKLGEKIVIKRFARFQVGVSDSL